MNKIIVYLKGGDIRNISFETQETLEEVKNKLNGCNVFFFTFANKFLIPKEEIACINVEGLK